MSIVWDPTSQTPLQYRMSIQEFRDVISKLTVPANASLFYLGDTLFVLWVHKLLTLFLPPTFISFLLGPMDGNSLHFSNFPHSFILISSQLSFNFIFFKTWFKVTLGHTHRRVCTSYLKIQVFWDVTQSSSLKFQILKMEAGFPSETPDTTSHQTRCNIPKSSNFTKTVTIF